MCDPYSPVGVPISESIVAHGHHGPKHDKENNQPNHIPTLPVVNILGSGGRLQLILWVISRGWVAAGAPPLLLRQRRRVYSILILLSRPLDVRVRARWIPLRLLIVLLRRRLLVVTLLLGLSIHR